MSTFSYEHGDSHLEVRRGLRQRTSQSLMLYRISCTSSESKPSAIKRFIALLAYQHQDQKGGGKVGSPDCNLFELGPILRSRIAYNGRSPRFTLFRTLENIMIRNNGAKKKNDTHFGFLMLQPFATRKNDGQHEIRRGSREYRTARQCRSHCPPRRCSPGL